MTPKSLPKAKVSIRDFVTKEGKVDTNAFWKLPAEMQNTILRDAVDNFKEGMQHTFTKKTQQSIDLLEALDKENPELGLSHYVELYKSMKLGDGSALNKDFLESLKEYDPETFETYLENHRWEAYSIQPMEFNFDAYARENLSKVKDADADIRSVDPTKDSLNSVEPNTGVLTDTPLNNASPTETSSGVLTKQPPELPKIGKTIGEAEASAYTGNEPPIADYGTPITSPGVHVSFIDAEGKPVDLTPEEITKFKPNSASSEAKAETVAGDTNTKATPETPETEGALTGNRFKNAFTKTWDFIKKHPKASIGGLFTLAAAGYGISQLPKLAKLPETKVNVSRNRSEESESPEVFDNVNYRVWENYNPDYLNEEYVPGKIPSHIPQDNFKESTTSKKMKNQPQAVNTSIPENNATADYVRAAYNSYIPSDAGRAYQKAIYGDPLELERNRLQQKWRDFVMRSGQSPAELVQRGLMPYDALQYI